MSENWSVQVSVKTPAGTLINLRGETPEQVENQIGWVIGHADKIVQAEQAFAGVANVAAGAGGRVVEQQSQSWSQQGSQQAPPQFAQQQAAPAAQGASRPPTKWDLSGPPPGESRMCAHGPMQWKHRVSKAGNEYKAWACTDRANPCAQEYVK